ncbi:MAG TPA: peptidase E [Ktedonobacterales bacterium]
MPMLTNLKTTIVAIGGGDLGTFETLAIDQEVVRLTEKSEPRALFIPTASGDSEDYWQNFQQVYGHRLGCKTEVLWLLKETPSQEQMQEKILGADLIYVGGGNTLRMMKRWRKLGVDALLRQAADKGTVLAGLSAGAICWCNYGHSDSMKFSNPNRWQFIRVQGLGILDTTICPHYHSEHREADFAQMVRKYPLHRGLALDDNTAIVVRNGGWRILHSQPDARAYWLYMRYGQVMIRRLEQNAEPYPLSFLLYMVPVD